MNLATCHGCLAVHLATDDSPRPPCGPCNTPDKRRDVINSHGRLVKRYNRRGQLIYRSAAADRLDDVGVTGRAGNWSGNALDMPIPMIAGPGMFNSSGGQQ